jgi:hypothetical protein
MGYDLHITRKKHWSDETGEAITEAEWRSAVGGDSGLREVVWFDAGDITAKNPGPALIRKMVQAAHGLGAQVQGDDGEIYREDGSTYQPDAPVTRQLGIIERIAGWFRHRRSTRELQREAPKFRVGQRVKNHLGEMATVLTVDPKANHGLGSVGVRYDKGREEHAAYVASGYEPAGDER